MKSILIFIILSLCFAKLGFGIETEIDPTSADALDFDIDFVDELDNFVDTYETIGEDLTKFHKEATDRCQHEIVHYDKLCRMLKKRYNKLKNKYIIAGNLIIEGIKNDNKKEKNIKRYRMLKNQILKELSELYKLIGVDYEKEKTIRERKEKY